MHVLDQLSADCALLRLHLYVHTSDALRVMMFEHCLRWILKLDEEF